MKKLIMTLLSVSLTTTCFAADSSVVEWDYLQPSYKPQRFTRFTHASDASSSSIVQRFTHADRFAEDIFTTSAAAGAGFPPRPRRISPYLSQFSVGLTMPDYLQGLLQQPKSLNLKTFREFNNEEGEGVVNILSIRFVEQCLPVATLEISQIIAQYTFVTGSNRHFKVYAKKRLGQLIDGYWKYLSSTVKQHFASSSNHTSSIHFLEDVLDGENGVTEIAKALGTTASLRLEGMRAEHNHLSPSTMASRLLTKHVNDLAQAYWFRQKLEHNHDWGINFGETFMQRILRTCVEDLDVVLLEPEGFGEDFYRQQLQMYYRSSPILRQVRLNPNGLPRDVERQFRRYFRGMSQQSLKQLR